MNLALSRQRYPEVSPSPSQPGFGARIGLWGDTISEIIDKGGYF